MNLLLYIIAFLEGFTTLSVEIMSIRNSIALIGSNSIATSIILGIILLALSYGYYRGGLYASKHSQRDIQWKIYINLIIASLFYTCISFPFENPLLSLFLSWDIGYFFPIFFSISLLFILPVFLASQTIPLLSELIDHEKKAVVLGKLLFFSTIGSFLGSVVTSLVFFSFFGVEKSIVINGIILAVLALAIFFRFDPKDIPKKLIIVHSIYLLFLVGLLFVENTFFSVKPNRVYSYSSEYNDIEIFDDTKTRDFRMNGSHSSGLDIASGKSYFSYIQHVTEIIKQEKPKKILVIGAAGFTLPQDIAGLDFVEKVDVCDIDGSLDIIAEKYFLQEKLDPKISFYKESARYFLNKKIAQNEKYDFIFIDAYNGKISIPSELLTKEFFSDIQSLSSGTISMNVILDTERQSLFCKKFANTITEELGDTFMISMNGDQAGYFDNFIVANKKFLDYSQIDRFPQIGAYTDDKNTLEFDKYKLFYTQKYN